MSKNALKNFFHGLFWIALVTCYLRVFDVQKLIYLSTLDLGDVQLSKLRVKNKATFADFNQENPLKVELNLKHDSKEDVLYSHLNYKDTNSKLAILSKESTLGKNDEGYLLKNIIMKDATDPITIKSGTILTVDKVYVKNAEIDEIRVKTVTGPVEGREVSNNVNDFLTKSLKVGDPSKVQSFKGIIWK